MKNEYDKLPRLIGGTSEERIKAELTRARFARESKFRARELYTVKDVKAWLFFSYQHIFEKDCN